VKNVLEVYSAVIEVRPAGVARRSRRARLQRRDRREGGRDFNTTPPLASVFNGATLISSSFLLLQSQSRAEPSAPCDNYGGRIPAPPRYTPTPGGGYELLGPLSLATADIFLTA